MLSYNIVIRKVKTYDRSPLILSKILEYLVHTALELNVPFFNIFFLQKLPQVIKTCYWNTHQPCIHMGILGALVGWNWKRLVLNSWTTQQQPHDLLGNVAKVIVE